MLIPFGMAAAYMVLKTEIGLGIFAAESVFIQIHGPPVVAHVAAQVAGPAPGLRGFHAFLREFLIEGYGRPIRFPGNVINVAAEPGGDSVKCPGPSGPAQTAVLVGLLVILVVFLPKLFRLFPTFQRFCFIYSHIRSFSPLS